MDNPLVRGELMSGRPYSWSHCEECASGVMWLVTCGACACVDVEDGSGVGCCCCCEVVHLVGVSKVVNMSQLTMTRTLFVDKTR